MTGVNRQFIVTDEPVEVEIKTVATLPFILRGIFRRIYPILPEDVNM
jgi:hypothetical protein